MAAPVMMALGTYTFSLNTAAFQSLQRTTAWRWVAQERMRRAPARQYLGPGEDTIALAGTIHPEFRGGLGQLNAMRAEAGKGKPLWLVVARGRAGEIAGQWCIESITESQTRFGSGGAPKQIDFTLALSAYGEDA